MAYTPSGLLVRRRHVMQGFDEKHGIERGRSKSERLGPGGQEAEMPLAFQWAFSRY